MINLQVFRFKLITTTKVEKFLQLVKCFITRLFTIMLKWKFGKWFDSLIVEKMNLLVFKTVLFVYKLFILAHGYMSQILRFAILKFKKSNSFLGFFWRKLLVFDGNRLNFFIYTSLEGITGNELVCRHETTNHRNK